MRQSLPAVRAGRGKEHNARYSLPKFFSSHNRPVIHSHREIRDRVANSKICTCLLFLDAGKEAEKGEEVWEEILHFVQNDRWKV